MDSVETKNEIDKKDKTFTIICITYVYKRTFRFELISVVDKISIFKEIAPNLNIYRNIFKKKYDRKFLDNCLWKDM